MKTLAFVLICLTTPAFADTTAKAKADATAAYAEGQRRYLAEDYAGAAKQFRIAYGFDHDPAYLFNIAQAYRFAKQCKFSAKYYRQFLGVVPDPPNHTDVARYVVEMDACTATQPEPAPEPSIEPETKIEPEIKPDLGPHGTGVVVVDHHDRKPERPTPGRTRRLAGLATAAVGAVGIGVGIAFGLHGRSLENERQGLCPRTGCVPDVDARIDDLESRGHTANKLAFVGSIGGGVLLGGGIALYLSGRSAAASGVAMTPTQGGALVSFTVRR